MSQCHARIKDLIKGELQFEPFDLVYSIGVCDYLDDRAAEALTKSLFALLRPRGLLVLGNFLPQTPSSAYVESFAGWRLILRSTEQLQKLAVKLPEEQLGSVVAFEDQWGAIGYLEITRR